MAVDVFVADEQDAHPVEVTRWSDLARSVLEARGVSRDAEVSVLFVDEAAIASLNEQFLGRSGPTDVLAFPIEDEPVPGGRSPDSGGSGPGEGPEPGPLLLLGDVVVCPAVAARNSVDHEVTYQDEMALLVVHGLLHLLGMDHEEDAEAEEMERVERDLLARFYHPVAVPPGAHAYAHAHAQGLASPPETSPVPPGAPGAPQEGPGESAPGEEIAEEDGERPEGRGGSGRAGPGRGGGPGRGPGGR